MAEFNFTLKQAREYAGFTQHELAEKMGVSRTTIINWESGKVVPGIASIQMISNVCGIPQDNIFLPCYSTESREGE